MVCPQCSYINADDSIACVKCATPLPASDRTLATGGQGWSIPVEEGIVAVGAPKPLGEGTVLGERYEIVKLLGQGGMGAVYRAYDRELEREVALKVIRSDMAANPEILKRFKQELILARQITHKNVIRIFDLGQSDGIKFITMEYIEGEDLQSVLKRKKKLEHAEAAVIMAQTCRALAAAHAEGVIHRDLKPQNIMLDKTGRVYVMDFGIARSMVTRGMTQTGALIGTPDYMSPEQAKGQTLDARSDLFTAGIILYEMLSGQAPFEAETTMAKLWKRTTEPARPIGELDDTIPPALAQIVDTCLQIDPNKRFASAEEIVQRIETWQGPGAETHVVPGEHKLPAYAKWAALGLCIVAVAAGFLLRSKFTSQPVITSHPPVTLLIADFDNKTGDPVFDGTLEPTLGLALEGAPFVSLYNRAQAHRIAAQLQPGTLALTDAAGRLVAMREGISVVVGGSITREDSLYRVSVKALDAVTGKSVATNSTKVEKKDILLQMGILAANIRKSLGDTTPQAIQLAAAETFTSASLEAAHEYAIAQDLMWAGKGEESIPHYLRAVQLDPNMGRAYAGVAVVYANMGQRQNSDKYFRRAMAYIDRMSEREKYRTRGGYYLMSREPRKAAEEYSALLKQYPSDEAGHHNLALSYFYLRDMSNALKEGRRAVELNPKNVGHRHNLALYADYAGEFDSAAKEANSVLSMNPKDVHGLLALAMAQVGHDQPQEAAASYRQMQGISAFGASKAALGLADIHLYQGTLSEAVPILQRGVTADLASKDEASAATKLSVLAFALLLSGSRAQALQQADRAVALDPEESVSFSAGRVYLESGELAKALKLASMLASRMEPEPQIYGNLLEGEVKLKNGDVKQALSAFEAAQKIADTWLGHFDLGTAYLAADKFTEADSEFETCLKRRGEASAVFLDDVPTYHLLPPVYYYLGRAQEGLNSPAAAESYKTFLGMKEKSEKDPLVSDARRRVGSH